MFCVQSHFCFWSVAVASCCRWSQRDGQVWLGLWIYCIWVFFLYWPGHDDDIRFYFFFFQFWTRLLETTFKKWSWRKVFVIGCVALVTWQATKAAIASLTNRATLLRVICWHWRYFLIVLQSPLLVRISASWRKPGARKKTQAYLMFSMWSDLCRSTYVLFYSPKSPEIGRYRSLFSRRYLLSPTSSCQNPGRESQTEK